MYIKKPVVGILTTFKEDSDHPYDTVYKIVDAYVKKIEGIDCIPIGLIDVENNLAILNMCDAFLLPGGNKVVKDYYYIIKHCIEKNKPMIGVCLGMQAMVFYDYLLSNFGWEVNIKDLYEKFGELKSKGHMILNPLESGIHGGSLSSGKTEASKENILQSKHLIHIKEDSILYQIYKKKEMEVISMHGYGVYKQPNYFKGISYADDGVLEAIQYKDSDYFIIGVQYHPEIEDDVLFEAFKKEMVKRR